MRPSISLDQMTGFARQGIRSIVPEELDGPAERCARASQAPVALDLLNISTLTDRSLAMAARCGTPGM